MTSQGKGLLGQWLLGLCLCAFWPGMTMQAQAQSAADLGVSLDAGTPPDSLGASADAGLAPSVAPAHRPALPPASSASSSPPEASRPLYSLPAAPEPAAAQPRVDEAQPGVPTERKPNKAGGTFSTRVVATTQRYAARAIGTSQVVSKKDLQRLAAQSGAEALRTVAGVQILAEDAMGLRVNIGMRGLDPSRGRKVLVMEDGVPVTLNPYGAPELYYSPAIERMEKMEVFKGSGTLLYGPQTLGGALNYVTRDPSSELTLQADVRYGSYGYLVAHAGASATVGQVGYRLEAIHRRFEGPRGLDLALTDVSGKLKLAIGSGTLRVRLGFYDESSAATYVGPTQAQFEIDPTTNPAQNDRFLVRRYAATATYEQLLAPRLQLQVVGYASRIERVWRRQEYDRSSDGAGLSLRDTSAIRDRRYFVTGIEPRITWNWATHSEWLRGELLLSARYHLEQAREQISRTQTALGSSGDRLDDEERQGQALAAVIQHRFWLWRRVQLTPALRIESLWATRSVLRERTMLNGTEQGRDVSVEGSTHSLAFLPGLGVAVDLHQAVQLFAGVHRGYAPPRSKDAVSAAGQNLQLPPEGSWNVEGGLRLRVGTGLQAEAAGFIIEADRLLVNSAGQLLTLSARTAGLELGGVLDPLSLWSQSRLSLPLQVAYTFVPIASPTAGGYTGYRLPYAAEHVLSAQLTLAHRAGLSVSSTLSWVSAQMTDLANTVAPVPSGFIGEIPGYLTLDARVAYSVARAGLTFSVVGKNLTNQVYVASRFPEGIQPAGFLQIFGAVEWNFSPR